MKPTLLLAAVLALAPAADLFAASRPEVRRSQFVTMNPDAARELAAAVLATWPTNKIVIPGQGANSILVKALLGTVQPRMPLRAPPWADAQVTLVKNWIDKGATEAEFTATLLPLFKQSCGGCHSAQSHAAGLVFDSYAGMQTSVNGH